MQLKHKNYLPYLKELQNYNGKLFPCPSQKKGENTTNISNCYFSN